MARGGGNYIVESIERHHPEPSRAIILAKSSSVLECAHVVHELYCITELEQEGYSCLYEESKNEQ